MMNYDPYEEILSTPVKDDHRKWSIYFVKLGKRTRLASTKTSAGGGTPPETTRPVRHVAA